MVLLWSCNIQNGSYLCDVILFLFWLFIKCFGLRFLVFFYSSGGRHTRGALVTGVQTCALPILLSRPAARSKGRKSFAIGSAHRLARVGARRDLREGRDGGSRTPAAAIIAPRLPAGRRSGCRLLNPQSPQSRPLVPSRGRIELSDSKSEIEEAISRNPPDAAETADFSQPKRAAPACRLPVPGILEEGAGKRAGCACLCHGPRARAR